MEASSKKIILQLLFFGLFFGLSLLPLGPRGANDLPYVYPDKNFSLTQLLPTTWKTQGSDGLGYYGAGTLWSWPLGSFTQLLVMANIPFWIVVIAVFIFPTILFSVLSIRSLLKYYGFSDPALFVSSCLYLLNTYFLLLIDGGQLTFSLAYSLFPYLYLVFCQATSKLNKENLKRFIVICLIISILDLRFLILGGLLFVLHLLFNRSKWKTFIKLGLKTFPFLVVFHLYWLIPVIFSGLATGLPESYTQSGQLQFLNFVSLIHAFTLIQPHWYKNIFGQITEVSWTQIWLPFLVFLPLLSHRSRHLIFWSVTALIAVFLAKGSNEPLGQIYTWLFSYLPGFNLFRDSSKFLLIVSLAYTVLLGYLVQHSRRRHLLGALVTVYLIFVVSPILSKRLTGVFSPPYLESQFLESAKFLTSPGLITWIPSHPPLGLYSNDFPMIDIPTLAGKRPFASGLVGVYEQNNFLYRTTYMGELFKAAGILYLVHPPTDPRRTSPTPEDELYFNFLSDQLSQQTWLKPLPGPINQYQVNQIHPLFHLPPQGLLVAGSDAKLLETGINLSDYGVIFIDQQPGLLSQYWNSSAFYYFSQDKTQTDLAAGFIPASDLIFPDQLLKTDPDLSGWWKRGPSDYIKVKDFLLTKYHLNYSDFSYTAGYSFSEGHNQLSIPSHLIKPGDILIARTLLSNRGGEIDVFQANDHLGEVSTLTASSSSELHWQEIGRLKSTDPITLSTQGDLNLINALAIVNPTQWLTYKSQALSLIESDKHITSLPSNDRHQPPIVKISSVTPARIKFEVTNLNKPTLLAYRQNYHHFWQLNSKSSFPIYGFLNGFVLENNGTYTLQFFPQKLIPFGLTLSFLGSLCMFWLLKHESPNDAS